VVEPLDVLAELDAISIANFMKKPTDKPNRSGSHRSPRRILSASEEQIAAWDAAATSARQSWADWAREKLDAAAKKRPR
jgi:hypothetical protein